MNNSFFSLCRRLENLKIENAQFGENTTWIICSLLIENEVELVTSPNISQVKFIFNDMVGQLKIMLCNANLYYIEDESLLEYINEGV